jgi:DNA-binding PadR family transcriptional regulator
LEVIRLTQTSYIVLGLIRLAGSATPYDLKRFVSVSVGHFWAIPHSQLYAEPARLAEAGLLKEKQEQGGRRRKLYSLTAKGRKALEEWQAKPVEERGELRDPALLKLFFGGDPRALAEQQIEACERQLGEYEEIRANVPEGLPPGPLQALDAGVAHAETNLRFWRSLLDGRS